MQGTKRSIAHAVGLLLYDTLTIILAYSYKLCLAAPDACDNSPNRASEKHTRLTIRVTNFRLNELT